VDAVITMRLIDDIYRAANLPLRGIPGGIPAEVDDKGL
jgi:hypothetical protein